MRVGWYEVYYRRNLLPIGHKRRGMPPRWLSRITTLRRPSCDLDFSQLSW
jgi:hypothetical protein